MTRSTRVLVVDDHRMFSDILRLFPFEDRGIELVGVASTGEEAIELAAAERPDVVLMDLDLPGMNGIEATSRLRELLPETKVLVVTAVGRSDVISRALAAGACGYVPKTRAIEQLVDMIEEAVAGRIVMPANEVRRVLTTLQRSHQVTSDAEVLLQRLTSREVQVLEAFSGGMTTAEVAQALHISQLTVLSHVKSILHKLGVHSRLEAVAFALRHGFIQVPRSA